MYITHYCESNNVLLADIIVGEGEGEERGTERGRERERQRKREMTSLVTPKRYMATIALGAPGCRQPSRYRWQASNPSWVGLRTGRELEERRISFFTAIKFCQTTNHL